MRLASPAESSPHFFSPGFSALSGYWLLGKRMNRHTLLLTRPPTPGQFWVPKLFASPFRFHSPCFPVTLLACPPHSCGAPSSLCTQVFTSSAPVTSPCPQPLSPACMAGRASFVSWKHLVCLFWGGRALILGHLFSLNKLGATMNNEDACHSGNSED